ncbi:hypothetical protein GCM10010124_32440 [Pilimelia terevasa]|uniref:DUF881 domain-containing protein n=1 Tax=Pilimelia terevasa TaxID=53372 RepID=A0A8J3BQV4_9ACTN|nr:DUF881 domain-containing protein [Pilimelia terevasa]GGK37235.1 hypothetical protein GCM10010124_32440 [Pilimelia terevasa]
MTTPRPAGPATPKARPADREHPPARPATGAPPPAGRAARDLFGPDFLTTLFRFPLDPGYADAAAARAAHGPRPPARRHAVRVTAAVVACAIGLLFAVAYRKAVDDQPGRARVRTGLVGQIDSLRTKTDTMQERATALRAEVARLRQAQLGGDPTALAANEAAAARTRVTGRGVTVVLGDPQRTAGPTGQPDPAGRIQDRDLRQLVNAVWAAGASAIEVNDVRLTATSTIRVAGQAIQLDAVPIHSPYRLRALGPATLRSRYLGSTGGQLIRTLAARYGMEYSVREAPELTLAAAGEPTLRHATPLRTTSPSGAPPGTAPSSDPPPGGRP